MAAIVVTLIVRAREQYTKSEVNTIIIRTNVMERRAMFFICEFDVCPLGDLLCCAFV